MDLCVRRFYDCDCNCECIYLKLQLQNCTGRPMRVLRNVHRLLQSMSIKIVCCHLSIPKRVHDDSYDLTMLPLGDSAKLACYQVLASIRMSTIRCGCHCCGHRQRQPAFGFKHGTQLCVGNSKMFTFDSFCGAMDGNRALF